MRYELLLQPPTVSAPFELDRLNQLLDVRAAQMGGGGRDALKLRSGTVDLRPLVEGGRTLGLEVHVPLLDTDRLLKEALGAAEEVAREAGLIVFDPQLIRPVTGREADAVSAQYLRHARYAAEIAGVSSAIGAGDVAPPVGLGASVKTVIGTALFLGVLYLIVEVVVANLR